MPFGQNYPPPFDWDLFYYLPIQWLDGIDKVTELDARDLICFHLYDRVERDGTASAYDAAFNGYALFPDERKESSWYQENRTLILRKLFERATYNKRVKELQSQRKIVRLKNAEQPNKSREQGVRVRYRFCHWPNLGPLLYRPRGYLEHRWPTWLGEKQWGSRLVLLALFYRLTEDGPNREQYRVPLQIMVDTEMIANCAHHLLQGVYRRSEIDKGIEHLLYLGAIQEGATPFSYLISTDVFDDIPQWSVEHIARYCADKAPHDRRWAKPLATIMRQYREPVTRLGNVRNYLQHTLSNYLKTAEDFLDLYKYLEQQRPLPFCASVVEKGTDEEKQEKLAAIPKATKVLGGFISATNRKWRRVFSQTFRLPVLPLSEAQSDKPLTMPIATHRGIVATQLRLRCLREEGVTIDEAQEILQRVRLLIWQDGWGDRAPVGLHLPIVQPDKLGVDFGFVSDANLLHGRISYEHPFRLLLLSDQREKRLTIEGDFVILVSRKQGGWTPKASRKNGVDEAG